MKQSLYLECSAGISGDMVVAALLDLGADPSVLMEALNSLPAEGFSAEIGRVKKAGIDCCDFRVKLDEHHENCDHDMTYLHGSGQESEHHHDHGHDGGHAHEHHHDDAHHNHGDDAHFHEHDHAHTHEHRGMAEITEILNACRMTEGARSLAFKIFDILAEAEAKAHASSKEQVHFHEVGAVDSIVDIAAAAVCFDNLGIERVIIPKLCEGTGTVRCQHGVLPIPVPAVVNIVASNGLNLHIMDVFGEFVTPTGAAVAAAVKTSDRLPERFQIKKTGIGAGKREYERPSILRAMLIEEADIETEEPAFAKAWELSVGEDGSDSTDGADRIDSADGANPVDQQISCDEGNTIFKLESNIDDCSGEALGYTMERLFEAGARDVHYMPVYMKKNRPGWQLNVICTKKDISKMEEIIFRETTTIGIRRQEMERTVQSREQKTVLTAYGEALVKVCRTRDQVRYYPEYESVAKICREHGLAYQDVFQMVLESARKE